MLDRSGVLTLFGGGGGFPGLTESDLSLHGIWAVCTRKRRHAPLGFLGAPPCIFDVQMKCFPKTVINAETSRWGCTTVSVKSHTKGSGRTLVLLCVCYFCSTTTEQPLNPWVFPNMPFSCLKIWFTSTFINGWGVFSRLFCGIAHQEDVLFVAPSGLVVSEMLGAGFSGGM